MTASEWHIKLMRFQTLHLLGCQGELRAQAQLTELLKLKRKKKKLRPRTSNINCVHSDIQPLKPFPENARDCHGPGTCPTVSVCCANMFLSIEPVWVCTTSLWPEYVHVASECFPALAWAAYFQFLFVSKKHIPQKWYTLANTLVYLVSYLVYSLLGLLPSETLAPGAWAESEQACHPFSISTLWICVSLCWALIRSLSWL